MKMSVKEFANFTGVSVRTLHYYDEIGLLKPAFADRQTGYRFYDESSLSRMQEILFFRELDFSLKNIGDILSSPHYNKEIALQKQKKLLILKKERLERLISAIENTVKGEISMSAFDNSEFEAARSQYEKEAKERWGNTAAYAEFEGKSRNYSKKTYQNLRADMDNIMKEFALCMQSGAKSDSDQAQTLVKKLQEHISEHYYTCTSEILSGLGQMYVGDERFTKNIDRHASGTAEYISNAISVFCG